MGLRNRGPYAPQRPAVSIDWAGEMAAASKARAEIARVEEEAHAADVRRRIAADPIAQLVERCGRLEQALTEERAAREENRAARAQLEQTVSRLEGSIAELQALAGDKLAQPPESEPRTSLVRRRR